jgi:hypothetical protein
MSKFEVTNESAVLAAIRAKALRIDKAGQDALMAVAFAVQKQAKINAFTGKHAPNEGHILGTGPGPNVGTGMLRRSISVHRNKKGFGNYVASVGPTVIYSRAVELGHPRWKSGVKYPYLRPAGTLVRKKARRIFLATFNEKMR